jgi:TolB-like protein/DNA-binding CsgD family transcriptional regulator
MATVWPGLAVTDDSLVQSVSDIRQALGKGGGAILKTVPRRDHKLVPSAEPGLAAAAALPSIAVLPFESLDIDDRAARLADGLTDEIIADLARHADIFVIARHSVLCYRGRAVSVQDVGRELGVRYVLEGSLQCSAERVRVSAQLIEALTGMHVWAERYDNPLSDVFEVQDALARAIVNRLAGVAGEVLAAERTLARRKTPESLEAYDLYVLGTNMSSLFTREGTREGIGFFERAVRIDPHFARAWHRLAVMHLIDASSGYSTALAASLDAYVVAAKRAAELDPNDAMIQATVAGAHFMEGDLGRGEAAYDRALALGPNDADTLALIAYTRPTKLPTAREDVELAHRAMRLNPLFPDWYSLALGYASYYAHAYEASIDAFGRARSDVADIHLYRALSCAQLGRDDEAKRHAATLLSLVPDFSSQAIVDGDSMRNPAAIALFLDGARKSGLPLGMNALRKRRDELRDRIAALARNPQGLSKRELQVLDLLAPGKSNRAIGELLFISPHTVANHVCSILAKTGAPNRTAAAAYAPERKRAESSQV